jgi:pantothenate kinase-related protein Tda10
MDSRLPFVKEVAKTIIKRHGEEGESFIFGISGKWGEGKTREVHPLLRTT